MSALLITSITEKAGKTMLCAGLGKAWLDSGKRVGYLKPFSGAQSGTDRDVLFMRKILELKEPVEVISPATGTRDEIKEAFAAIAGDKDAVIVDGGLLNDSGSFIEALDMKVLAVHDYSVPLTASLKEYQKLGSRLAGLVVNKVPVRAMSRIRSRVVEELSQAGIELLGMIPEDRILMTMSVADLAEAIEGKILNNQDGSSELIENIMMGSSTFDRGAAYYNRKINKAVILWGERPGFRKAALANFQAAALQTSTRCIIISANGDPNPAVTQKAEEKQVPLISAPGTIQDIVSALEAGFKNLKFSQEKKLTRLSEVLRQHLNFQQLSGIQGMKG